MSNKKLDTKENLEKIQEMIYQNMNYKQMSEYFDGVAPMTVKNVIIRNNLDTSQYHPQKRHRRKRITLTKEDMECISNLLNTGSFKKDVASKFGISIPTLENIIKENNIDISGFKRKSLGNTKNISEKQQMQLQKMLDSKIPYKDIAKVFGVNRNLIKIWINRYNLSSDVKNIKPEVSDEDYESISLLIKKKFPINKIAGCIGKSISNVKKAIEKHGIEYSENEVVEPSCDDLAKALNYCYNKNTIANANNRVSITSNEVSFFKKEIEKRPFFEVCKYMGKSNDFMLTVTKVFNLRKMFIFSSFQKYSYFNSLKKDLLNPRMYSTYLSYKYGISYQSISDWRKKYGTEKKRGNIFYSKTSAEIHMEEILESLGLCFNYQYKVKNYFVDYYIGQYIVIDVQGDYWHKNKESRNQEKIDDKKKKNIQDAGFTMMQIWEHDINNNPNKVADKIKSVYLTKIQTNFLEKMSGKI